MSFHNHRDHNTWYWDNLTLEEGDNPLDDLFFSCSAHERDLYKHYIDNPEQHFHVKKAISQAFSNPSTLSTSSSQETKHWSTCTTPAFKCNSSEEIMPHSNNVSSKSLFYPFYVSSAPFLPPLIYSIISTHLPVCNLHNQESSPIS
jgi:hypothetical protein